MRPLAVGLTPLETRREVILHVALRAEELGYDAFYLAEGWSHDAAVLLAEIATRTSRIQLGTGVLNVWGRSPASIAMLATTLHEVSGGRFSLGLGAGSPQLAEGLHDVAFQEPVARLGAVARQVRTLLDGGRMVPATTGTQRPLRLATGPTPDLPIHLAALGPQAVRLTGEIADGWSPFLLPLSAMPQRTALLAEGAARSGRALPRVCPSIPVGVSPDPVVARQIASWWVTFYLTSMGPLYRGTLRRLGLGEAVDAVLGTDPAQVPASAQVLLDELTLCGDADTARAGLDRWYAAGADMPVLALPPNRSVDELDHILEGLAPLVRS